MNSLPGDLFARRLRQERERLGISQAELARRIAEILGTNVDPSAVTRIEQQIRAVRLDEAVAAAKALDVPLALLVADDHEAESEGQLQQYLADLALAQREWEKSRLEVLRITRAIQALGGSAELQARIDPRLMDSIDARVPLEDETEEPGPTSPSA
ncbi:helix-turn-helix domain-containing protein [Pseudarthrobacter sp. GA104]|uniref:helix-turn-helix domain-containing protein n=1 Tax=Pseudarthrobacter sp. GA104 TaxID=2676311 RepID=UPI0012FA5BF8|nr:helix-turn-helix transcriptional regulator [Pseudarthrobacter sp. GA104]MUU73512.1 helix-turn-helix domain-containing protein [Pseudarthrobacter sp. GA104]